MLKCKERVALGKATAVVGLIYRALGHDFRVCLLQFIKESRISGELVSSDRFKVLLDVYVLGERFTVNRPEGDPCLDYGT